MTDTKTHNRKKTVSNIQQAIKRIQGAGGKLSISAVARNAGVTPSLIHNTYPDLAEQIRDLTGKTTRRQRDAIRIELNEAQKTIRALRHELTDTKAYLAKLASVNQVLLNEVALLRGVVSGKVVQKLDFDNSEIR